MLSPCFKAFPIPPPFYALLSLCLRMTTITFDEFKKVELRTARVKAVEDVPGSEKLYKITLDVGGEERVVLGGLKPYYTKEELMGKTVIMVYNLQPKKMFGMESQGMLLAVEKDGVVSLLTTDKDMPSGLKVW